MQIKQEFINLTNKKFKKSDYLKLGLPKNQVQFFLNDAKMRMG